jgi:hypothetical protein
MFSFRISFFLHQFNMLLRYPIGFSSLFSLLLSLNGVLETTFIVVRYLGTLSCSIPLHLPRSSVFTSSQIEKGS